MFAVILKLQEVQTMHALYLTALINIYRVMKAVGTKSQSNTLSLPAASTEIS